MRKIIISVTIVSAISLLVIGLLAKTSLVQSIEEAAYDYRVRYFGPHTDVSKDIVMVWIDEDTIVELPYRSPVPRDFLAGLNRVLVEAGAKIIAYDIFFEDPTVAEIDNLLAESFAGGRVYTVSAGELSPEGDLVEAGPHEVFQEALDGFALSDLPLNAYDATVRSFQPFRIINKNRRATFASELVRAATGRNPSSLLEEKKLNLIGLKFYPSQKTADGELKSLIRYAGPPSSIGGDDNTFPAFSANLVAKGFVPTTWLSDKIVMVGAAYEYSQDVFMTPYFGKRYDYRRMNGVEVHTNILNSLLMEKFYYQSSFVQNLILCLMIALFVSFCSIKWRLTWTLSTLLVMSIAYIFLIIFVFNRYGLVIPVITPFGTLVFSLGLTVFWRAVTEGKQKRLIKNVFSHYVSKTVVNQMISDPSRLVLGGETRRITCMFTDIESFTTISEKLDPQVLVTVLNDYFNRTGQIILKYGGTLDKYEGDAMIAFFGAPMDLPDHEEAAVKTALEIQQVSEEMSRKWKEVCGRGIVTRIGINTGPAVVGNMGSTGRFDYTAMGDTVNLASRLEVTNKNYGTRILISESTRKGLSDNIFCRPIDRIKVKGKTEAVEVFEPTGVS